MTAILLASFRDSASLMTALRRIKDEGGHAVDAFTPYPVDGLAEELGIRKSRVRPAMLAGGLAGAALAYGLEWYSAVIDLPINSGGRPLHSWQVFYLFPFEFGILAAAIVGIATLLVHCGLPRLHHPLFGIDGFETASQDGFLLAVQEPDDKDSHLRDTLLAMDALWVREGQA